MNSRAPTGIRLGDIAIARSGDKGNRANIGVAARNEHAYAVLLRSLTAARVGRFLAPLCAGEVRRYELPGIMALNFVIECALAGGASGSLKIDTQGKALGTALMELRIPENDQEDA